ncbi:MAG: protein-L-isoaspartate(D-aspartate) O-methyltransferase [Bacteroidetes bacterium]|nr:protein-L-isoaspartate(D-aspartate) O-methyltransferase [Bacteroidota bacterium]MBU1720573.1 protein-L-isoaspartate(D-aspartate) O-methyltransferase [Bacteroidota bacterium]
MYQDTYRHQGMRRKLVETVRMKGISDENVLQAIGKVPRHFFMESSFLEHAYEDNAFPIAAGQTISQPYTVAFMTQLLEIKRGEKVLEIGTGSGYQACILQELGAKVFSIERQKELYDKTKRFLSQIGYVPKLFFGDGYKGLPSFAPFTKIIVTAGAPFIPEALKLQLVVGGKLVIPVGEDIQIMTTVTRLSADEFEIREWGNFRFVPLLQNREGL